MTANERPLPASMLDDVLARLGLNRMPSVDLGGLADVYYAWSHRVPFDNVRKLIHLGENTGEPLAGDDVRDFFQAWLAWGTGGTCWAGNGALCSLLQTLGFDAVRGVGTMLVAPDLPPNHGTVVVRIDGRIWLVDASILYGEPLLLDEENETRISHPARGVRCAKRDGRWHVRWRPLQMTDGLDCRLDTLDASAAEFHERHEATRAWSPFNYEVHARANAGDRVVGLAFGDRVEIAADGSVARTRVDDAGRRRVLVEEVGLSPTLVERLAPDRPTPPPPWSNTAAARS